VLLRKKNQAGCSSHSHDGDNNSEAHVILMLTPMLLLSSYPPSSQRYTKSKSIAMTGTTVLPGQAGLPTPSSTEAYWHKDPSKALYGHRTTATLPSTADVVIVGSGISGASAAHFIREEGTGNDLKIVMLEAREACWGATGRVSLSLLK
jgi:hypothetical protein